MTSLLAMVDTKQFTIIMVCLFCMGAGTGFERSLLPRMAVTIFNQHSAATRLNFVATFGLSKAIANAVSGPLADKFGRKPTLIMGFLVGLPVMPYVIIAETWTGITVMNIAFGLSQGLLGSALFFLLIDLMGPSRRGIAVGLGECMIYVSTALVNVLAGDLATKYGFRPVPFYVATGFAVVGLLSTWPLTDTLELVQAEQTETERQARNERMKYARMADIQPSILDEERALIRKNTFDTLRSIENGKHGSTYGSIQTSEQIEKVSFVFDMVDDDVDDDDDDSEQTEPDPPLKSFVKLITNPNYVSLCFTGLIMNFKDGFAWGSFPVFFSHAHKLSDKHTDMLVALYPLCWGFAQAFTGALSDKFGRKLFLVAGTASCAIAMAVYAVPGMMWGAGGDYRYVGVWIGCDVLLGLGTALAYPALQAAAADEVDPVNRGLALGFYRFTRDMGYVVGAIVCGRLTDAVGYEMTFLVVSLALAASLISMAYVYTPIFDPDSDMLNMKRFNVDLSTGIIRHISPDARPLSSLRKGRRDDYVGLDLVYGTVD
jgi:MFS family permease